MLANDLVSKLRNERLAQIDSELKNPAPAGSHDPIPPETPEELGAAIAKPEEPLAGVSARVRAQRAARGEIPQPVAGKAVMKEDVLKQGHQDLRSGKISPEQARAAVKAGHSLPVRGVVNAHYENLVKAEAAAEKALDQNPNDPQARGNYERAKAATAEWSQNVLDPAANAWSSEGHSMQGDYPVKFDSLAGIKQAAKNKGVTIPKEAEPAMKEVANQVRYHDDVADQSVSETADKVIKELKPTRIMEGDELTNSLQQTLKDITCGS
jgi:hypothetical protein